MKKKDKKNGREDYEDRKKATKKTKKEHKRKKQRREERKESKNGYASDQQDGETQGKRERSQQGQGFFFPGTKKRQKGDTQATGKRKGGDR